MRSQTVDLNRSLEAQPVAHVVEADGTEKLGEEHRCEMAGGREGAGLVLDACLTGDSFDHSPRNEVEHLLEADHIGVGWCLFGHITLQSGRDFR